MTSGAEAPKWFGQWGTFLDRRAGAGRERVMKHLTDRDLRRDETLALISSEKVRGTRVHGSDQRSLGHVDHLMIDKRSGRVSYAVIAFGGVLGIGERLHPLPWEALSYDPALDGYRAAITREDIEGAPHSLAEAERWSDPKWRRRIHEHFGKTPMQSGA